MSKSYLNSYFLNTPSEKRRSEIVAYLATLDHLQLAAPSVTSSILQELQDQRSHLKLIASENYSSLTVQLAMGNLLTDKYSEGYPFHRFYAGCENVDKIEDECAQLAKNLFQAEHAYVQPHSGADANLVAFWAVLTQRVQHSRMESLGKKNLDEFSAQEFEELRQYLCNQTLLGLSLHCGGHLTHGFRQNVSAKMMRAVSYDVDPKTGYLNYDTIAQIARREKPLILLAGYSAYPRHINFAKMREIADEVGAVLMVDMAHFAGLVAGKAFTGDHNPVPFAHILTSTTHKTLRGPRGGLLLCCKEFSEAVNKGCPLILGGPLPHVMAAKHIAFHEATQSSFQEYASQIIRNAQALAAALIKNGLKVITNGTDNHLVLIDLTSLGLTGRVAETALKNAKVTSNRNMIPWDSNGAWYTSGIRLGTPAVTTLGMKESEMEEIGALIAAVLKSTQLQTDPKTGQPSKAKGTTSKHIIEEVQTRVAALMGKFPLYPELPI